MDEAYETRRNRNERQTATRHDDAPRPQALDAYGPELAEQGHPLALPLLRELHRAILRAPDQLPDDVVTLDRFVTYRLGGWG